MDAQLHTTACREVAALGKMSYYQRIMRAKSSAPAAKQAKRKAKRNRIPVSGGERAVIIRHRLRELSEEAGSNRAFAKACGVSDSVARRWLSAGLPSAVHVVSVADAFGVNTDWILGYDVSKFRAQSRTPVALEEELSARISRAIVTKIWNYELPSGHSIGVRPKPKDIGVDAAGVIDKVATEEASIWIAQYVLVGRKRVLQTPTVWDRRAKAIRRPWEA